MKIAAVALASLLPITGCIVATDKHVATTPPGAPRDAVRTTIATKDAPAAIGPYAQAVQTGDTLWLAGQIGLDPRTGAIVSGGTAAETRQALANLDAVLRAAGFTRAHVVQTQVYLADLADFEGMNGAFAEFFGATLPARATVQVAALPRGARVEILAVARR